MNAYPVNPETKLENYTGADTFNSCRRDAGTERKLERPLVPAREGHKQMAVSKDNIRKLNILEQKLIDRGLPVVMELIKSNLREDVGGPCDEREMLYIFSPGQSAVEHLRNFIAVLKTKTNDAYEKICSILRKNKYSHLVDCAELEHMMAEVDPGALDTAAFTFDPALKAELLFKVTITKSSPRDSSDNESLCSKDTLKCDTEQKRPAKEWTHDDLDTKSSDAPERPVSKSQPDWSITWQLIELQQQEHGEGFTVSDDAKKEMGQHVMVEELKAAKEKLTREVEKLKAELSQAKQQLADKFKEIASARDSELSQAKQQLADKDKENTSLKCKIAIKDSELNTIKQQLADALNAKRKEEDEHLIERFRGEMQEQQMTMMKEFVRQLKHVMVEDSERKADSVRGDLTRELEELKEPIHLPTVDIKKRGSVAEVYYAGTQQDFLVQCYPFFIHDFHLRGLHHLAPDVQEFISSEPLLSGVEVLHPQSIEGVFKTRHVALSKLIDVIIQAGTKGHSLSLSTTCFHFAEAITLHRFHFMVDSEVLIDHCSDQGCVLPKAFFVHASVELKDGVIPPKITATPRGTYYLTSMRGQIDLVTEFIGPHEQKEEGVIKLLTDHLDGRLARHLDNCYASLPKSMPVMSVPECYVQRP